MRLILAQLQYPRLVKAEQVMLQLLLGWGLDTDTQISSNKCKVNQSICKVWGEALEAAQRGEIMSN